MNGLKIRYEALRALAIAYLAIPSVVFLAGWAKAVVAASCIAELPCPAKNTDATEGK